MQATPFSEFSDVVKCLHAATCDCCLLKRMAWLWPHASATALAFIWSALSRSTHHKLDTK